MEQCGYNVDIMWNIVEECGCFVKKCGYYVEECGCFVDVIWNLVEDCGCFVEKCGCNVDPPHLHISQFDQVLSPLWSVILKYAIVGVMWIHQIFTLAIKWTADPFVGYTVQCICYPSLGLVSGVSTVPELWHYSITSA